VTGSYGLRLAFRSIALRQFTTWCHARSLNLFAVRRADVIGALQDRIDRLDWEIRQRARSGPRVKVLTQLPGIGPFTALVILAEVGDVSRFASARQLASWAGLTPTVRGSDRVAHYGHISKQGSVWLRWVLCEAAQTAKAAPGFRRQLPGHRQTAGKEDRHHRHRPQAGYPCLAPAR
jgi:transposase